jgi:hypothetical protein
MKRFFLPIVFICSVCGASRDTIITDPAVSKALKDRYVALTGSWASGIEFTPAEQQAMQAGKQWEALGPFLQWRRCR